MFAPRFVRLSVSASVSLSPSHSLTWKTTYPFFFFVCLRNLTEHSRLSIDWTESDCHLEQKNTLISRKKKITWMRLANSYHRRLWSLLCISSAKLPRVSKGDLADLAQYIIYKNKEITVSCGPGKSICCIVLRVTIVNYVLTWKISFLFVLLFLFKQIF